jgi:hypothetical protein
MAEPVEWDETTLQRLISDGVGESLTLDNKAGAALTPRTEGVKKEMGKDVSAFANSAGGTIVYGLAESDHLPTAVEGIDPALVTREWLDQVITSRIQRRIDGVRINQILLADGKVVYVVVVPQSDRAPHMASDKRYYKRFEYQSVPMEEYEVRDVSNRAIGPRLAVQISLASNQVEFIDSEPLSKPIQVRANILNSSPAPAEHAVLHWLVDQRLDGAPPGFTNRVDVHLSLGAPSPVACHLWQLNWGVPGKMPIWEGMNFALFDSAYQVRVPRGASQYILGWSAKAPRMAHGSGVVVLEVRGNGSAELGQTNVHLQV